jgi:MFS transporter, DHA2 family, methylenomycin A resistance protein
LSDHLTGLEDPRVTRRRRLTLVAMCIAQGMTLLDVTIVNTALPSIQRELHMTAGQLEWVISAYALSLAAFIPLGGALGDRFGRKRFFLAGMVVFTLGSVACALSTSDVALIGSRALQGAGGAFMSALTLAILTETYPVERRAGAFGMWAAISGLGFGLGPVVGGALLSVFSWSSVFWVNVPVAVVGFVIAIVAVTESRNPEARQLDAVGMVAVALGLLGITFGLIESSSHPWTSLDVAAPLVVGIILVVFFVLWESRTSSPMLPPSLLRARSFVSGCGVYLLTYLALAGVMFYVTLLFQDVEGWSPFRTGVSWLSMNIPFIVTAQFAGRLRRRFQPVVIVVGGCLVGAVGVGVLALLSGTTSFAVAFVGYVLVGVGWGTLVPGVVNVAMRDVPPGVSGGASGLVNAARQVGTSVGLAVLGTIGVHAATTTWADRSTGVPGAAGQAQYVAAGQIGAVTRVVGAQYRPDAVAAFVSGYHLALLVAAGSTLLAAVVAALGLRSGVGAEHPAHVPVRGGRPEVASVEGVDSRDPADADPVRRRR